jgi:hypothetical protein
VLQLPSSNRRHARRPPPADCGGCTPASLYRVPGGRWTRLERDRARTERGFHSIPASVGCMRCALRSYSLVPAGSMLVLLLAAGSASRLTHLLASLLGLRVCVSLSCRVISIRIKTKRLSGHATFASAGLRECLMD